MKLWHSKPPGNRQSATGTDRDSDRQTDSALWAHILWLFWLHTHWIYENSKPNETKIDLVSRLRNLLEFCGCAGGGNGLESRTASRSIEGSTDCVGCKETSRSSDQSVWRMNQSRHGVAWPGTAWFLSWVEQVCSFAKRKFQGATCQKKMGPEDTSVDGRALEILWFSADQRTRWRSEDIISICIYV